MTYQIEKPQPPVLDGNLRSHNVRLPRETQEATGICVLGRTIRSIVYTTDIAIIRNCDADAVYAVYPFTPQQIISKMLIEASSIPVFVGVGGGTTNGSRSALLAKDAEAAGAYGVVLNAPVSNFTLEMVSRIVDIPVVVTVVNDDLGIVESRLESGASIISVSGGKRTPEYVASIRAHFPEVPVIATGGKSGESILATVQAGANSVIVTPPSNAELFSSMMERYRETVEEAAPQRSVRPLSQSARTEVEQNLQRMVDQGLAVMPDRDDTSAQVEPGIAMPHHSLGSFGRRS